MNGIKNAWLSPTGELVTDHENLESTTAFHFNIAIHLLKGIYGFNSKSDFMDFELKQPPNYDVIGDLEKRGWIRLHGFGDIKPIWIISHRKDRLTRIQELIIERWCDENNRHFGNCFNTPYKYA